MKICLRNFCEINSTPVLDAVQNDKKVKPKHSNTNSLQAILFHRMRENFTGVMD